MARVGRVLGSYRETLNPSVTVRRPPAAKQPMVDTAGWSAWRDSHMPGAAPAPVDPAAPPPDPTYDAQVGGLTKRRDTTIAGLGGSRASALLDYGYNATTDANGNVTDLTFDPNNPNSRAAQLKRRYNESKQGTLTNYAARGQLYAGSLNNAQDINAGNYQRADDSSKKALFGFLARNSTAVTNANTDYETGVGVAGGDRLTRATTSPLYNPSSSPGTVQTQGNQQHQNAGAIGPAPNPIGAPAPRSPNHGGIKGPRVTALANRHGPPRKIAAATQPRGTQKGIK